MDFGALPPEVNSGRMYCGPGSAPMVAAASAWNGLAAELSVAAVGYERVIIAANRRMAGSGVDVDGRSGRPVCGVDASHRHPS